VQAVKRNIERFSANFMFQLNAREFEHFEITIWGWVKKFG
jgi:hypothetical protein